MTEQKGDLKLRAHKRFLIYFGTEAGKILLYATQVIVYDAKVAL
jgi:hypothetical protein